MGHMNAESQPEKDQYISRDELFANYGKTRAKIAELKAELFPDQHNKAPEKVADEEQVARLEFMLQNRNSKDGISREVENLFRGGARQMTQRMIPEGWENRKGVQYKSNPQ